MFFPGCLPVLFIFLLLLLLPFFFTQMMFAALTKLGFEGLLRPTKVTCQDHTGGSRARVFQWDGKAWKFVSDWIDSDQKLVRPMIEAAAKKYAAEKNLPTDACKQS